MIHPIDVARARQETPGCSHVLHFNNAGAALMPTSVSQAITAHLELEARIGGYEAADQAAEAIEATYASAARLLGCQPEEIACVENATRAWDMAFYAIPFRPGDRILTAMAEYASNYIAYLQVAQRTGARVEVIPNDESGQVSVEALRRMVDARLRLISITHVPTNGGLVNPAVEIGQVAREAGCLYLLDACQSVGQMPIDVSAIGCDMLSATGRKYLRGPRGAGLLYVRKGLLEQLEPPFLDDLAATWISRDAYEIRPDARRFENWESYVAGRVGLGVAIDYALGWGLDAIWERIVTLGDSLRRRLGEIRGVAVRDLGRTRCGIVSFTVEGKPSPEIQQALHLQKINITTSSPASTRLDMEARRLPTLLRASVHYYNTDDEIERFAQSVEELI